MKKEYNSPKIEKIDFRLSEDLCNGEIASAGGGSTAESTYSPGIGEQSSSGTGSGLGSL